MILLSSSGPGVKTEPKAVLSVVKNFFFLPPCRSSTQGLGVVAVLPCRKNQQGKALP